MNVNYYFVLIALVAVVVILRTVVKGKIAIDESFFWLMGAVAILGLAIYPGILDRVAVRFGVDYPPSLLFTAGIVFLLLMNLRLNKKIAILQEKLITLGQEVAILRQQHTKKKGK